MRMLQKRNKPAPMRQPPQNNAFNRRRFIDENEEEFDGEDYYDDEEDDEEEEEGRRPYRPYPPGPDPRRRGYGPSSTPGNPPTTIIQQIVGPQPSQQPSALPQMPTIVPSQPQPPVATSTTSLN